MRINGVAYLTLEMFLMFFIMFVTLKNLGFMSDY